jgi:hypothetical protein
MLDGIMEEFRDSWGRDQEIRGVPAEDMLVLSGQMVEIELDREGKAMYDPSYSIVRVLMRRDGLSRADAVEMVAEARQEVLDGADPEEVLADSFGLEPDYIWDLIGS